MKDFLNLVFPISSSDNKTEVSSADDTKAGHSRTLQVSVNACFAQLCKVQLRGNLFLKTLPSNIMMTQRKAEHSDLTNC